MKNLAGNKGCDVIIRDELTRTGIEIVELGRPMRSEVPASIKGQLTKNHEVKFTFVRGRHYWVVDGNVPFNVANEIFANTTGRKDVRVAGHSGWPSPEEQGFPSADEMIKNPDFVYGYHIYSQKGLDLFVSTLKKYGLID